MSIGSGATRLNRLELRNFRGFERLNLDLEPRVTVLVSDNGGGKTAILDAIALAWSPVARFLAGRPTKRALPSIPGRFRTDIRQAPAQEGGMRPADEAFIHASGEVCGMQLSWQHWLTATPASSPVPWPWERRPHRVSAAGSLPDCPSESPQRPLLVYYGARRGWERQRLAGARPAERPHDAFLRRTHADTLLPAASFQYLRDWIKCLAQDPWTERIADLSSGDPGLVGALTVRSAVDTMLAPTGWHSLAWDRSECVLVASHPLHGQLPIGALGEGVQLAIGLVADLALCAISLNPGQESQALAAPGLVLIDEVELLLSPRLQQLVVPTLLQIFPGLQFVVTTRSPLVLTSVDAGSIRVLHLEAGGGVSLPPHQTRGVGCSDALSMVMGTDPVPPGEEARWVRRYLWLLDSGLEASVEGLDLYERLVRHFGSNHPILLDCSLLSRWQSVRDRSSLAEGDGA